MRRLTVLLFLVAPLWAQSWVEVEGDHYALRFQGSEAEAAGYLALLEAAWDGFAEHFGKEPRLKRKERLRVVFAASHEDWVAALRADDVEPPGSGGYYWPGNKTAYTCRQPTIYYTRVLLLHEAAHQFHYLACTGNKTPTEEWYIEGLAEYISQHFWDGERLELGVLPLVSQEDRAGAALRQFDEGLSLAQVLAGEGGRPPIWALVRYLLTSNKKLTKRYERLAKLYDRGGGGPRGFEENIADPAALEENFRAWLREEQELFTPVFLQWQGIAADRVVGVADGVISFCASQRRLARLAAELHPDPADDSWRAGLLLDYGGRDDYTIGVITRSGRIQVQRSRGGQWDRLADEALSARPPYALEAVVREDGVVLRVGETVLGPFTLSGSGKLGLAVDATRAEFRELDWE